MIAAISPVLGPRPVVPSATVRTTSLATQVAAFGGRSAIARQGGTQAVLTAAGNVKANPFLSNAGSVSGGGGGGGGGSSSPSPAPSSAPITASTGFTPWVDPNAGNAMAPAPAAFQDPNAGAAPMVGSTPVAGQATTAPTSGPVQATGGPVQTASVSGSVAFPDGIAYAAFGLVVLVAGYLVYSRRKKK